MPSIYDQSPVNFSEFVDQAEEIISNGELEDDVVQAGDGGGAEVLIQVYVPDASTGESGKVYNIVGLEPREDGKAILINLGPVGLSL